jgi:hypothetical protein
VVRSLHVECNKRIPYDKGSPSVDGAARTWLCGEHYVSSGPLWRWHWGNCVLLSKSNAIDNDERTRSRIWTKRYSHKCSFTWNIDTNYHKKFSARESLDAVVAATPLQRLGTANDIADVIVFLCSDGARFIQGQVIEVNGGFLMV